MSDEDMYKAISEIINEIGIQGVIELLRDFIVNDEDIGVMNSEDALDFIKACFPSPTQGAELNRREYERTKAFAF